MEILAETKLIRVRDGASVSVIEPGPVRTLIATPEGQMHERSGKLENHTQYRRPVGLFKASGNPVYDAIADTLTRYNTDMDTSAELLWRDIEKIAAQHIDPARHSELMDCYRMLGRTHGDEYRRHLDEARLRAEDLLDDYRSMLSFASDEKVRNLFHDLCDGTAAPERVGRALLDTLETYLGDTRRIDHPLRNIYEDATRSFTDALRTFLPRD